MSGPSAAWLLLSLAGFVLVLASAKRSLTLINGSTKLIVRIISHGSLLLAAFIYTFVGYDAGVTLFVVPFLLGIVALMATLVVVVDDQMIKSKLGNKVDDESIIRAIEDYQQQKYDH